MPLQSIREKHRRTKLVSVELGFNRISVKVQMICTLLLVGWFAMSSSLHISQLESYTELYRKQSRFNLCFSKSKYLSQSRLRHIFILSFSDSSATNWNTEHGNFRNVTSKYIFHYNNLNCQKSLSIPLNKKIEYLSVLCAQDF